MTSAYNRRQYKRNRALVLEAAGWQCAVTGCRALATTADHVVPVALGGTNDLANLRAMCAAHNYAGGARLTNARRALRQIGRTSRRW